jgi:proline dehydrogenase
MEPRQAQLSFSNTEIAFKHKSDAELRKASILFKSFDYPVLLRWGPALAKIALSLGLKGFIKSTIFSQFCGGEDITDCEKAIQQLSKDRVGTILDYSVEGADDEQSFNETTHEIIETIKKAKSNANTPFSVFKVTGIVESDLLEKVASGKPLDASDRGKWEHARKRFFDICNTAKELQVRLFIDAEESWLQDAIDGLAVEAMQTCNQEKAIIYNTLQMYRHDRLEYLKQQYSQQKCYLGFKIVRGAYMEKERLRAQELGYQDPIQKTKEDTDHDYDEAIHFCLNHIDRISVCVGTHNEKSSHLAATLMQQKDLDNEDSRVYFSQLLGMSDHISYNLAHHGYCVAKYVPYGPVKAVIPYLTRRAQENSGMAGQMGRELGLITQEIKRRKNLSK